MPYNDGKSPTEPHPQNEGKKVDSSLREPPGEEAIRFRRSLKGFSWQSSKARFMGDCFVPYNDGEKDEIASCCNDGNKDEIASCLIMTAKGHRTTPTE